MWPNLIDCLESDLNFKSKLSYLNTLINVHGLNLEVENEIKLVKSKVKQLCADVTKRTEGLLLLYAVVHCSSTLYVDNWSQIVLGSLKCPDSVIPKEIPLKVLNRMLTNFGSIQDYNDVFSKVLNDVFPIILNPEDDKIYKLSCQSLAVCMRYVPKIVAAGNHLVDIEKLLLKELDHPYGEIIEAIGDCFAALPDCILCVPFSGPSDYKGIWCNIFLKFINTMHSLLNNLMKLSADQAGYVDVSGLPVFAVPSSESDTPIAQIDIFKSLCQCMAKMISSAKYGVRLPIQQLFETLYRVFSIEEIVQGQNQDVTVGYIKFCFPQLMNGVYILLEAIILNFHLHEHNKNFVDLMDISLKAMKETFSQSSSVSQVRGSTWKLINIWLKQYGVKGASCLAKNNTIIAEILKDIDVEENKNAKLEQLKTNNVEERNQNANKIFSCTHALKVLKSLVEINCSELTKTHLHAICSTILRIAKIVLQHILLKKRIPFPYSDEKCRKLLLDSLFTLTIYNDRLQNKCIIESQNIFNAASRDDSAKVRRISHRFRKLIRYYLNPRKPPPDAIKYSHTSMVNTVQKPVIESVRTEWGNGIEWNNTNGHSSDDQMDDNENAHVHENVYSDKMESESDLAPVEQADESESHMNHEYRRIVKHSMVEEESIDDSDIEPAYISTDSNQQKISLNDSSHLNSFGVQSCVEQYSNERRVSEAVVPNLINSVENNIEGRVSAFIEVKSAQKAPQVPVGNGEWKKKENCTESSDEDSDMEEEGEEEVEANEEVSDNVGEEASDGKRSPEFDEENEERNCKRRRRCLDEEGDDYIEEEVEDEDIPDEEGNEVNDIPVLEQNAGTTEKLIDEESQDDNGNTDGKSPTIREMCGDFVLAEPSAPDIS